MRRMISLVAAAMLLGSGAAMAQVVPSEPIYEGGEPGIAVSGTASATDLPQPALKFICHYFPGLDISQVKKQYTNGAYDVDFANGLEIEFSSQGNVLEIEAPEGKVLSPAVIRSIMPHRAYDKLKRSGALSRINSIDLGYNNGKLVKIETVAVAPQDIVLDLNGNVVLVETNN